MDTRNSIYIWTQLLTSLTVSIFSMIIGYSAGYTSTALETMEDGNITSFTITEQEGSWVAGVMPLAGLAGSITGGPLIEIFGRKITIFAIGFPFIISWLIIGFAINIHMILVGRAICGFCIGIATLSLPVYLGETIQPEIRGTLGLLPTLFGNGGILVAYAAGKYLNWSNLAFLAAILSIPYLILMILIPETPRWYVGHDKVDHARKALVWLRGRDTDVEPELKTIITSYTDTDADADAELAASTNIMLELLNHLKPLSISLGLMFFQQFSGINAVIFYSTKIFEDAGSTIDIYDCSIVLGVVNTIATLAATLLIDRLGRKILLYISGITMTFTLFTLGGYFYYKSGGNDISNIGWLPLASCVIYVVSFSLGFGPIPWLMMGEILPGKIRSAAASIATAYNWTCTFIITKTFQDLIDLTGDYGAFWLYGTFTFTGLFFVFINVPETKGKSLEEIELEMLGDE